MPFSVSDLLFGFVIPALITTFVCTVTSRLCKNEATRSLAANVALAAGFVTGVWLLKLSPVIPATHWHYLPYVAILVAVSSAVEVTRRRSVRFFAAAVVLLAGAFAIVPTWEDLSPSRPVLIGGWFVATLALSELIRPLALRHSKRTVLLIWTSTTMASAILLVMSGSLRFGQLAGCLVAVTCGLAVQQLWLQKSIAERVALPHVSLLLTALVSGVVLIGQLNSFSNVPVLCYVAVPLAPLGLWVAAMRVPRNWKPVTLNRIAVGVPFVVLTTALGVAGVMSFSAL